MKLIVDTREQDALIFVSTDGVEIVKEGLLVGDYSARFGEVRADVVVERKSIADLFSSYSSGYSAERDKILKASQLGLRFILAIEGTIFDVRKGFSYWKDGEEHHSKADGYSMVKRLMKVAVKYHVEVWFCGGRREMAFHIMEYFLAKERLLNESK